MGQVGANIKKFFEDFENGANSFDLDLLGSRYAEVFLFGGPQGTQSVRREDFLRVLPKRQGFFKTIGLASTHLRWLEETRLDEKYTLVKAGWLMRFEKADTAPIDDENSATYILFQDGGKLQIVFQLDHQDLMKKAQSLGLI